MAKGITQIGGTLTRSQPNEKGEKNLRGTLLIRFPTRKGSTERGRGKSLQGEEGSKSSTMGKKGASYQEEKGGGRPGTLKLVSGGTGRFVPPPRGGIRAGRFGPRSRE